MQVVDATDLAQEELEVIPFRKTSQLRGVVQANINQSFDLRTSQKTEKIGGGCLREADGKEPKAQGRASSLCGASSVAT